MEDTQKLEKAESSLSFNENTLLLSQLEESQMEISPLTAKIKLKSGAERRGKAEQDQLINVQEDVIDVSATQNKKLKAKMPSLFAVVPMRNDPIKKKQKKAPICQAEFKIRFSRKSSVVLNSDL